MEQNKKQNQLKKLTQTHIILNLEIKKHYQMIHESKNKLNENGGTLKTEC